MIIYVLLPHEMILYLYIILVGECIFRRVEARALLHCELLGIHDEQLLTRGVLVL